MKKILIYISVPIIITLACILIPAAFAAAGSGETSDVTGSLSIGTGAEGCHWTGTPGLSTSNLNVPDGEICIISAAGWSAREVTVAANATYGGGTLVIGSASNSVTFTINNFINNEGTIEIGVSGNPAYDATLDTQNGIAPVNITNGGVLTVLANSNGTNKLTARWRLNIGGGTANAGTITNYETVEVLTGYVLNLDAGAVINNSGTFSTANMNVNANGTRINNTGTFYISTNTLLDNDIQITTSNYFSANVDLVMNDTAYINVQSGTFYVGVWNNRHDLTMNDSSSIENAGTVDIEDQIFMNDSASLENTASTGLIRSAYDAGTPLIQMNDSSTLTNAAGATIDLDSFSTGLLYVMDSAVLTNNGTVGNLGVLTTNFLYLGDSTQPTRSGGTVVNSGTFTIRNNVSAAKIYRGYFQNNNPGTVSIGYTFSTNLTVEGVSTDLGEFENNSTSTLALTCGEITINSFGLVDQNAGRLNTYGSYTYQILVLNTTGVTGEEGTLDVASGSEINARRIDLGDATPTEGGILINAGTLYESANNLSIYIRNSGQLTNTGTINANFYMHVSGDTGIVTNNNSTNFNITNAYIYSGIFNNNSGYTMTVSNWLVVFGTGVLNNQGLIDPKTLTVGDPTTPGGTLNNTNNGKVRLDNVTGSYLTINDGGLIENSAASPNGFDIDSPAFDAMNITDGGTFRNNVGGYTIVKTSINITSGGLLDLNGGSFVRGEGGLYVNSDGITDGEIQIASDALLDWGSIELGTSGGTNGGKITNNGTIQAFGGDNDLYLKSYNGGEIINNNGALINKRQGYIELNSNSTLTNNTGGEIRSSATYSSSNHTYANDSNVTIVNSGTWSDFSILNYGSFTNNNSLTLGSFGYFGVYTDGELINSNGAEMTTFNLIGNGTGATITTDGELTVSNQLSILNGAEMTYNDWGGTHDYSVGTIKEESYNLSSTEHSIITVASGVTLNTTGSHTGCTSAPSGICSIEVGNNTLTGDSKNWATAKLILNGTLSVPLDASNDANIVVGGAGNGQITVNDTGVLDVNETYGGGATFYVLRGSSSTGVLTVDHTADLEMPLSIAGNLYVDTTDDTDATVKTVHSYTVTSTGYVNQGITSTVTVEGSTTTISGTYELDGTLDTGEDEGDTLTVTSTGNVYSGTGTTTNFNILAHDLTVDASGLIASDGKSSIDRSTGGATQTGGGSYGGQGLDINGTPAPAATYGTTKVSTPDYGMRGEFSAAADGLGGGGVLISSTGDIIINGTISANGAAGSKGGAGSGGTVIINHNPIATGNIFTGSGTISADGGNATYPGGGGRIIINSKLLDDPDFGSYDFGEATAGTIEALGGANGTTSYAAAGTIVYLNDTNNPDGTLIIDQGGNAPDSITYTDDDVNFSRIEVRGSADADFADLTFTDGACYASVDSTIEAGTTCDDTTSLPDKPDTLYINDSAEGAGTGTEPGYIADKDNGVSDSPLTNVLDITPVFSAIYRNPDSSTSFTVGRIEIQVADDPAFGPGDLVWNYSDTIKDRTSGTLTDGERSADVEYNVDSSGDPLSTSVIYYVRVRFSSSDGLTDGLWSHADWNDQYKFQINDYYTIAEDCDTPGVIPIYDAYPDPTTDNVRNVTGDRYGNGYCHLNVDSTAVAWQLLIGKNPDEEVGVTSFDDGSAHDINPINNTDGGTACEMDTDGNGTVEEYGYNIWHQDDSDITFNIQSNPTCSRKYDNSDQGGGNEYMFDMPDAGDEDVVAYSTDDALTTDGFYLRMHAQVNSGTYAPASYSLGVRAIITVYP